ncbi:MAG: cytochrome c biogenesis CcdA family protein [Acidobacteriota bacterium]
MTQDTRSQPEETGRPAGGGLGWGLGLLAAGLGLIFVLMVSGMVLIPRYRAAHPATALQRSDADRVAVDDMFLDLTLVTPAFRESRHIDRYLAGRDPDAVLPVLVGVNTHTGTIEHMHHLDGDLVLVGPDGGRYPSLTEPIVLSQHHNAYMFLFPARDNSGNRFLDMQEGALTVEALNVGATPVRHYRWDLPIEAGATTSAFGGGLAGAFTLILALVGALLVVLSPCALELTLYYSAIISCTVTEGEREAAGAGAGTARTTGRRRVLVNLASFVAGFTLLYAASGATVGLIGEGVRRPLQQYGGVIQIIGGSIILLFGLKVVGLGRLLHRSAAPAPERPAGRWGRLLTLPGQLLTRVRQGAQARAKAHGGMRARDSFLVGLGLSSACLTCMGGAVLYPLLIYIGITSWYWGLTTLGLYSLGIALPMLFIALGFFRVRMTLARRLGVNRALRLTSGALLSGIGLLILSGNEKIITDLSYGMLARVSQWLT